MTVGPDKNLWVLEGSNTIAKVTITGVVTEYTGIGGANPPRGITAGPDGNLWITEYTNVIDVVNTSGSLVQQIDATNPTGSLTELGGIAAGPDGNLWYNELNQNVDRLSTAGVITRFTDSSLASLTGIVAGPDGNLWAASQPGSGPEIVRVSTSGAISTFPLPSGAGGDVVTLTAGKDGNVWFTELYGNSVDKITPDGTITRYAISTPPAGSVGNMPHNATVDADGNIWFCETLSSVTDDFARLNADGTFTRITFPSPVHAYGTVLGPDNYLWVAVAGRMLKVAY